MKKMKREIRDKRNKLRKSSMKLRELTLDCGFEIEKTLELRKKQDDQYKRYEFYDEFIKANEKVRRNNE